MKYSKQSIDNGGIVYSISGEMKSMFIKHLHEDVSSEVEKGEALYFEFNFSETEYIDSQGISLIVLAGKYNHNRGKNLTIKHAPDRIKKIFALAEISFLQFTD